MYINVTLSMFRGAFYKADRKENFSYEGLEVIYDYLTELEEDTDEKIELDVIAICCDFYENDYKTIVNEYDIELDLDDDFDGDYEAFSEQVREYLEENTAVLGEVSGGFVYQCF